MGPPRNHTVTLLDQKDQEIKNLKLQLQAYAAHTSTLRARLISTQNALDALQSSYDEALRAEQIAKRKLQQQLKTYYKFVESAEYEKDDLRNAVESFLQKVQQPHIIWPQSRLHISSLLEPADSKPLLHHDQNASANLDENMTKYAAAMIETLVRERDSAREAHQAVLLDAKARISALESELARRDYELESYASHGIDCPSFRSKVLKVQTEVLTPMDHSSMLNTLRITTTRQKLLEQGNQQLERHLQRLKTDEVDNSQTTIRMPPANEDQTRGLSSTLKLIAQVDEDLQRLGRIIQAYASEREHLQKMVAGHAELDNPPPPQEETTTPSPRHETGTVHGHPEFQSSIVSHIPQDFTGTTPVEQRINNNLPVKQSPQIHHASAIPDDSSAAKEGLDQPHLPNPLHLLDAEDGEISMELATPLLPTTFLSSPQLSPHSAVSPDPILSEHLPLSPALVDSKSHLEQNPAQIIEEVALTDPLGQDELEGQKMDARVVNLDNGARKGKLDGPQTQQLLLQNPLAVTEPSDEPRTNLTN
ncbi:hypothetical protein EV361DRAFT_877109 [Lentinula raphanica]|uniref:Uncharacterized protein n=1 Tax=Lentinula raphanica TaxID=153919 RepID=A0AA38ULD8_9AGAR|nr:hypothetical protein F5880DRAFT_1571174 [Lentinula raphanica]KAJ3842912.1 hypothetical protein F5878DRAFT_606324 [Lentinula raphanica]KAJ3977847.1 hypothetical protein EV361DRAFT_877109 [Lentinula raphanica]